MKKAEKFEEIDSSIRFNVPVGPDDPFFVDFRDVRGSFYEELLYKSLNISFENDEPKISTYNVKKTIFIAGHRGSGKTSEIKKWVKKLNGKQAFLCITCNIDSNLDMNDIEFIDILIYKLECLAEVLKNIKIEFDETIISLMNEWFEERISEINNRFKGEAKIEAGAKAEAGIPGLFKIFASIKSSITDSSEKADIIRSSFKNRFNDFANKFNLFLAEITEELRKNNIAEEVLFFIDGLEKTMSTEHRRRIIIDESNRIQQIEAVSIYTLPIELMKEENKLKMFSTIISFPFIKIKDRTGKRIAAAYKRLEEFIIKRINPELFEDMKILEDVISYSGGSPRELLRILQYCLLFSNDTIKIIDRNALNQAIDKLSKEESHFLTDRDFSILKRIQESNQKNIPLPYIEGLQNLLEHLIVFEYNDGTFKDVNPVIKESEVYKYYVNN